MNNLMAAHPSFIGACSLLIQANLTSWIYHKNPNVEQRIQTLADANVSATTMAISTLFFTIQNIYFSCFNDHLLPPTVWVLPLAVWVGTMGYAFFASKKKSYQEAIRSTERLAHMTAIGVALLLINHSKTTLEKQFAAFAILSAGFNLATRLILSPGSSDQVIAAQQQIGHKAD